MGKVGKGVKCSVTGCGEDAVRSVSPVDVSHAGLKVSTSGRGYLCKNHYKEMKKKGVEFTQKLTKADWGSSAKFSDPDGNIFWLAEA